MEASNSFFKLKKAFIYSVTEEKTELTPSITSFVYFEDINRPFVTGLITVLDSGRNFIGTLPIQGGERVEIVVEDVTEEEYTYDMYVHNVSGRAFTNNQQQYILGLISREAIFNEGVRIVEPLEGLPNEIVTKILQEYLETEKAIFTETAKYKIKFFPEGKKAHSIINQLSPKAVPQSSENVGSGSNTEEDSSAVGKSSLPKDTKTISGTAGYLFFENRVGFNFKSVDYYFSDGSGSFDGEGIVETYTAQPTNSPANPQNRFIIEDYRFTGEIDLFAQMRNGVYSTYLVFYNYSTGAYEEYTYNLADSFENQSHLGSQSKLGKIQKDLSSNPTRIVSAVLDHETWYNGEDSASPEKRDGGNSNNLFPDFQKYYMAQAFSRYYTMDNQKLEITIAGNPELKAGDKIKVLLPNMVAGEFRDQQPYDEENSGTYLISRLGHNYDPINNKVKTKLELIRDTYGMKEYTSNVK